MTDNEKLLIAGCGILEKEIRHISQKNGWDVDFEFFDSTLHCNFAKLAQCLRTSLEKNRARDLIVFYGACHPRMDRILTDAATLRTDGQNCVEMLLGKKRFTEALLAGAFFLLEDWALRWDHLLEQTYSRCRLSVMKEIFQTDRKFILAVRTPCSGDFAVHAQRAAAQMQVPLKWMDVSLDHLELVLQQAMIIKQGKNDGTPTAPAGK